MFYNCHSLITLPDISKWNCKYLKNNNDIFSPCTSSPMNSSENNIGKNTNSSKSLDNKSNSFFDSINENKNINIRIEDYNNFNFFDSSRENNLEYYENFYQ